MLKENFRTEGNNDEKGTGKLARGKVGRSQIRSTVQLATERAKKNKSRKEVESEESSSNGQGRREKSTKKFECIAECPIYYKEQGIWKNASHYVGS